MGYTHYWTVTERFTDEQWQSIIDRATRIIGCSSVPVQYEDDIEQIPELSDSMIRFNGVEPDGYETFILDRSPGSAFCKTAYRPYDEIVVAILGMVSGVAPDNFSWSSDGDHDDHKPGRELYERASRATKE